MARDGQKENGQAGKLITGRAITPDHRDPASPEPFGDIREDEGWVTLSLHLDSNF